ncbi:DNA-directed RNA polymerase beta' subunit [Comamonas odontotermitis]|uniref:DNA-directed RNA polymerase beta' subunit n=1 Tax=Comamonas odontotermitis TaxID=379895 RepID=A0ABR6RIG4_9BURK|nr:hypothetical protein [Comamonas odontotermitis]MBB6578960.1 DNA-directed RNA polymerase beta' subunit [Comamonas odontotermitis]
MKTHSQECPENEQMHDLMGLTWFRQREEAEIYDSGKRSPAARRNQATTVNANAITTAKNAIAKAMASSKKSVALDAAFA